jgi:hypothetical protein
MDKLKNETAIWLYRKMIEIRSFEEATLPYFQKPGHGSHRPAELGLRLLPSRRCTGWTFPAIYLKAD